MSLNDPEVMYQISKNLFGLGERNSITIKVQITSQFFCLKDCRTSRNVVEGWDQINV